MNVDLIFEELERVGVRPQLMGDKLFLIPPESATSELHKAVKSNKAEIIATLRDRQQLHTWAWNKIGECTTVEAIDEFIRRHERFAKVTDIAEYRPIYADIRDIAMHRRKILLERK